MLNTISIPVAPTTITSEQKWIEIRQQRDFFLKETDWTQLADITLNDVDKEAYKVYRQALRDLPQQNNNPFAITFPTKP